MLSRWPAGGWNQWVRRWLGEDGQRELESTWFTCKVLIDFEERRWKREEQTSAVMQTYRGDVPPWPRQHVS